MPSGYTAALHDGEETTFEQFALRCARAFGALIMMRDDPLSAPIPTCAKERTEWVQALYASLKGQ